MTHHAAGFHSDAATFANPISATVARWHRAYRSWRGRRETLAGLQSLSNAGLKDIGIDRSEILSVVYDTSGERVRHHA